MFAWPWLHKENYAAEAVRALALDAIREYGTTRNAGSWPHETTPCLVLSASGRKNALLYGDGTFGPLPQKHLASCERFFSSEKRDYDPDTAARRVCYPALIFASRNGETFTHSIAVVEDADTSELREGVVSAETIQRLLQRYDLPGAFSRTVAFVRGEGLDCVAIQLVDEQHCDGFKIFSYQVEVRDPRAMLRKLEAQGYHSD